jgi:Na+-driven multidrug efflux pump
LFVRGFTDIFKSYAQAQDIIAEIGYYTMINLVIFPFYAYIFLNFLQLGPLGYGLSLLIYELGNCIIGFFVFKYLIHSDTKSTDIPISDRLGWYICEIVKNFVTMAQMFIAYNSVILILSSLHDEAQIGAYTIMISVGEMVRNSSRGFSVYGRTEVSKLLGKKDFKNAKTVYFKMLGFLVLFCVVIHIILIGVSLAAFKRPLFQADVQ